MAKKEPVTFESPFNVYTQGQPLGQGGSGKVYEVSDAKGQTFALKLLDPEIATRMKRSRFQREIEFCKNVHPNIVNVLDSGTHKVGRNPLTIFYVMRKYDMTLRKAMQGGYEREQLLGVLVPVMKGLDHAHRRGSFHRDLKPQNVLVTSNLSDVVVADWGIAHFQEEFLLHDDIKTKTGDWLGNRDYAAPEQRTKGMAIDHRADIYALGLMLNEIFTGVIPHGQNPPRIGTVVPDLAVLDALVDRMTAHDPRNRPQSVEDVLAELSVLLESVKSNRRIEELKRTKIAADPKFDRLLEELVEIVPGTWDYDPDEQILSVRLTQPITGEWAVSFAKQNPYQFLDEAVTGRRIEPAACVLRGDRLFVAVSANVANRVAPFVTKWIAQGNRQYRDDVNTKRSQQEEAAREKVRREIEKEEQRKAVRKLLNQSAT